MSSARNHQKRSCRSYRVTKSICGSAARKAWIVPPAGKRKGGLFELVRRLLRGRAQRTADRKRAERASRKGGQRGAVNGDLVGGGDRAVVPNGGRSEKADQGAC